MQALCAAVDFFVVTAFDCCCCSCLEDDFLVVFLLATDPWLLVVGVGWNGSLAKSSARRRSTHIGILFSNQIQWTQLRMLKSPTVSISTVPLTAISHCRFHGKNRSTRHNKTRKLRRPSQCRNMVPDVLWEAVHIATWNSCRQD
jgi:hypothetical protein